MRADKLIAMLQELPADAEVNIWNGFVQDVQDVAVEIVPVHMSKYTFEQWLFVLRESANEASTASRCGKCAS